MDYLPGKHVIATLQTKNPELISDCSKFKGHLDELIAAYDLEKLGEVYHNFSPAGFTAVVCLSESHISVHTWPEHGKINMDIYLSNYQRNNDGTVQSICDSIVSFFSASITHHQVITR